MTPTRVDTITAETGGDGLGTTVVELTNREHRGAVVDLLVTVIRAEGRGVE